jgi:hypothetical protein
MKLMTKTFRNKYLGIRKLCFNIYKFCRQRNNCLLTYIALHISTLTGHHQMLQVPHTQPLNFNPRIPIYTHMVQVSLLSIYIQFIYLTRVD